MPPRATGAASQRETASFRAFMSSVRRARRSTLVALGLALIISVSALSWAHEGSVLGRVEVGSASLAEREEAAPRTRVRGHDFSQRMSAGAAGAVSATHARDHHGTAHAHMHLPADAQRHSTAAVHVHGRAHHEPEAQAA